MPLKIKSTSGSVTLDAQNVAGDQTLTVPSIAGGKTLLTTDGDGSSLTGVLSFGGDTFGADKTIGSNDNYALSFETNATERLKITSDGRGLSQFTAKAWITFSGYGTISIEDSHNVSSIADNAAGNYQVNLSHSMANTNYTGAVTTGGAFSGYSFTSFGTLHSRNVSYFGVNTTRYNVGTVLFDSETVYILIFGD